MTTALSKKMDVELERAIMRNDPQSVDAALANGSSPDAVGELGYPMVSWAIVSRASVAVLEKLIKAGANVKDATLNGTKPSPAELAMAFCRPDVAAYLHEVQAFEPEKKTLAGTTVEQVYQHGEPESKSKMDMLFLHIRSARTARAIEDGMGPLEDAFSPAIGNLPRKVLSPL